MMPACTCFEKNPPLGRAKLLALRPSVWPAVSRSPSASHPVRPLLHLGSPSASALLLGSALRSKLALFFVEARLESALFVRPASSTWPSHHTNLPLLLGPSAPGLLLRQKDAMRRNTKASKRAKPTAQQNRRECGDGRGTRLSA